jgi:hypothetical protein
LVAFKDTANRLPECIAGALGRAAQRRFELAKACSIGLRSGL